MAEANDSAVGPLGPSPDFVHLRVHSAYSLLEGALPLKKILSKAVGDSQPAIAITDSNNLFVALEFSQKAMEEGLQPIIGCQVSIDMEDGGDGTFGEGDFFLFYAPGPHHWVKDSVNRRFTHIKNIYSEVAYYFINIGGGAGRRLNCTSRSATSLSAPVCSSWK